MVLTVLIITVALGTEPELQRGVILLSPSADCTLVSGNFGVSFDVLLKFHLPFHLLRSQMNMISGFQIE